MYSGFTIIGYVQRVGFCILSLMEVLTSSLSQRMFTSRSFIDGSFYFLFVAKNVQDGLLYRCVCAGFYQVGACAGFI